MTRTKTTFELDNARKEVLLSHFKNGIIALDLETTGLSPLVDRIIEVAAMKLNADGSMESFSTLVNPKVAIPEFTTKIHGIYDTDVIDSPYLETVLPAFLEFAGGLPIIAHNAKFDAGFIVFALHGLKMPVPENKIYCSCVLSRKALKDMPNHKLGTLAKELNIPLENHHMALDDAAASLAIFGEALKRNIDGNIPALLEKSLLFSMDQFKKFTKYDLPDNLKGLARKTANQHIIDIKYSGGTIKNQFRPVRLVSFLPMPEGNVLYAQCLLTNLYKSFAIKKITDFRELNAAQIKERIESSKKNDEKK